MAQPMNVTVTLDLPDGVEFLGYERVGDGHGIEVKFPLPDVCQCDACGHEEAPTYGTRTPSTGVVPLFDDTP